MPNWKLVTGIFEQYGVVFPGIMSSELTKLLVDRHVSKLILTMANFTSMILQYNTIQILLSPPHGGFSETIKEKKNYLQ